MSKGLGKVDVFWIHHIVIKLSYVQLQNTYQHLRCAKLTGKQEWGILYGRCQVWHSPEQLVWPRDVGFVHHPWPLAMLQQ
jgi:hypothetical protein